jgi:Na+-translocating ferredoxin:NAD+ oxidoreductase RNF subunit RnfB
VGGFSFVVVALAAIAVVVGVPMLRPASRIPAPQQPLVTAILETLPGGNCGACGNDSCYGAARAVAAGRAPYSVCVTGGATTAAAVARVSRAHGRA